MDEQAKERAANATEINNGDLYDYVEKGDLIGNALSKKLILQFQKNGEYLDYQKII